MKPSLVVVASSTGGPVALRELLSEVERGFPAPILVVQHILVQLSSSFAQQLSNHVALDVREATDGELLAEGCVRIAPAGRHMEVRRGADGRLRAALVDGPPENSVRPAADVLFRSAAAAVGAETLGIVLTGMGSDGLAGSRAVHAAGGRVWIQEPTSAVVASMPACVQREGIARHTATPRELGRELMRVVDSRAASGSTPASPRAALPWSDVESQGKLALRTPSCSARSFEYVRGLLKQQAGISLAPGKEFFVASRLDPVARDIQAFGVDQLVDLMRLKPFGELHLAAIEALTVHETSFFRDAPCFQLLLERVLPEMIERRSAVRSLRIWSAACSTGEEPYSVSMLLSNRPELAQWDVWILASDISRKVLRKASEGLYNEREIGRGVPVSQVEQFFVREGRRWRVRKELSARVEFRNINLQKSFAFPRPFDLVFLRNVLIYFDEPTKRDVLTRILKSMSPDGILVLGSADALRDDSLGLESLNFEPLVAYRRARAA